METGVRAGRHAEVTLTTTTTTGVTPGNWDYVTHTHPFAPIVDSDGDDDGSWTTATTTTSAAASTPVPSGVTLFFGEDGPLDLTYPYSGADAFGRNGAFYVDMAMKLDCGRHRAGIATDDVSWVLDCGHQRADFGAIDDLEVIELGMHLAENGFNVVQSRRSKAKMRSRAAACGRDETLSTVTDMKLQ